MTHSTFSQKLPAERNWRLAYWVCQILGWGLYASIGLAMVLPKAGPQIAGVVVGYGLYFLYSIGLTDGLRRWMQRHAWFQHSPGHLVFRLAGAALLIATIQAFLILLVQAIWFRTPLASWDPKLAALMWLNSFAADLVWVILYAGIGSIVHTNRARRAAVALELAAREARLKSLEAQLSPHFLFNSLNSVRGMIGENPRVAQDMVTRLANILRHNLLAEQRTLVSLREQIEVVRDYLELEIVRFEERLSLEWAIEPEAEEVEMPSMILQTLVENAIKHGISRLPEGGQVKIAAEVRTCIFYLEVGNTGRLGSDSLASASAESTGVGLRNLRERLNLLHGSAARFELKEEDNKVVARIQFPLTISDQ
jgi:two-component sensor histidine kinase